MLKLTGFRGLLSTVKEAIKGGGDSEQQIYREEILLPRELLESCAESCRSVANSVGVGFSVILTPARNFSKCILSPNWTSVIFHLSLAHFLG